MKIFLSLIKKYKLFLNLFLTAVILSLFVFGVLLVIKNDNIVKNEINFTDNITKIVWKFGRTDGSTIAERIKFLPNKKISGYASGNEVYWGIKDKKYFVFYNSN